MFFIAGQTDQTFILCGEEKILKIIEYTFPIRLL